MFRKLRLLILLLLAAVYSGYAQVPVAQILASPQVGCPPLAVSFTDASTNSPTSRVWNFPGGLPATSTLATVGVSYSTPGTYVATLVSTNGSGSSAPDTVHILVEPVPVANFTKNNPPVACYPTHVQFTNTSVPQPGEIFTSYLWNFGDGQQSTATSPDHRYTSGGNFKVELYVTNNYGCTGNSQTVVVNDAVVLNGGIFPNFVPSLNSSCTLPVTASFANTTTTTGGIPAPTWNWDFGDGGGFSNITFSPQHPYNTAGTYTVRLAATSSGGCSDTFAIALPITASGNLTSFTSQDTVCVNSSMSFTNSSSPPPSSSAWDFGDGTTGNQKNMQHTFTTVGLKHVVLTNTYVGCTGTYAKDILVVNPPVTSFTGTNLNGCKAPLIANFTNTSTGADSWFWDFGDGTTSNLQNPGTHTYTTLGNFTVTLTSTAAAGCSMSQAKTSYVKVASPTVKINNVPAYGCAPYVFAATATPVAVDGVASYSWDLGNGVLSNAANPPAQSYGAGTWTIKLTITTTGGCTASDMGTVQVGTVKPVPAFSFVPNPVCVASAVNFTSTSAPANKWFWEFGDGSVDNTNTATPTYSYTKPGTYNGRLTAYDNGCWDSISHSITVSGPLAGFSYAQAACQNNNFLFTDTSTGPITTWLWDFGDGTTFSGQFPPAHAYPPGPPKAYTVKLTVSNPTCTSSTSTNVTANQVVGVKPSSSEICKNTVIQLSKTPSGGPYINQFEFGDGTYSAFTAAESIGISYAKPGVYIVKIIEKNTVTGCIDSSAGTPITVDGPTANFVAPPALTCQALTFNFVDNSTPSSPADPITGWNWDFGDGTGSTNPSQSHTYSYAGNFTPSLIVTDKEGCLDTFAIATPITVSIPVASFKLSADSSCPNAPTPIRFINTSIGGFNPTYSWNFGDGGTSTAISPLYTYAAIGNYTVSLSMKDMYGCISNTTMATPIVVDTPHANFTMSGNYSACPPFNVTFAFTGSFADSLTWNFDDGNGARNIDSPSNLYSNPRDYYPNLIVISPGGCQSYLDSQHVRVDGPVATFAYSPVNGCDSLDVTFKVTTSNTVSFVWNFGDGTTLISDTIPTKLHRYYPTGASPGPWTPIVTLKDAQGCKLNQVGTIPIEVDSVGQTSFTVDRATVCDSGTVNFNSTTVVFPKSGITSYTWNFGDGTAPQTGMFPTISHDYTTLGNFTASLNITTLGGCTGGYTLPVTVAPAPKIAINGLVNQCQPATLNLTGIETTPDPDQPLTWAWNFGNGQTATGVTQNNIAYPKAGEYVVYAKATDSKGCSAMTDTAGPATHLFIYPIPTVNAGPDVTICDTSFLQINATGTATSYTWQPPTIGNLSCLNCYNPIASAPSSTSFIVTGTTLFGCTASDTINVTVNTQVTVTASGTDSVCLGQNTPLTASGASIYTWTPSEGLSNPNIANPVATPDPSQIGTGSSNIITYTVTGYDSKKCYSDTKSVNVTAFKYPVITMPNNASINVGSTYAINSTVTTNVVSLNWTPANYLSCNNCLSPVASPMATTKYTLEATNDGGCTSSDSIRIQVICNGANFFVPNSFSPNGDGVNDYFIVNGVGLNVIPSITIYNRWGQIVFQKSNFAPNSASQAWDGTFNGQPAPPDVYVYTIQILCNNATLISYHGDVTLIR